MDRMALQSYTARITQANRSELVVIMYEIILGDFSSAKKALEEEKPELFKHDLKHAQRFIAELMDTLDFQYELSKELMSLYIFVNRQLIEAVLKTDAGPLKSAANVMNTLKAGFDKVSIEDKSGPVMQNTQQVYAGLTYGKGVLNETYSEEPNRGFKA